MKPSINWLLVFIPITLGLEHAGSSASMVFFSAALAIVPVYLVYRVWQHYHYTKSLEKMLRERTD